MPKWARKQKQLNEEQERRLNQHVGRRLAQEMAETNKGQWIGLIHDEVVAMESTLEAVLETMHAMEPDPNRGLIFQAGFAILSTHHFTIDKALAQKGKYSLYTSPRNKWRVLRDDLSRWWRETSDSKPALERSEGSPRQGPEEILWRGIAGLAIGSKIWIHICCWAED